MSKTVIKAWLVLAALFATAAAAGMALAILAAEGILGVCRG
nr:MAG TPA: hypothetical protein [Caudoviricetes sp.]